MDEPWVCLGEFNEILSIDEKRGGRQRPERQIQQFKDALDDCGLMDLGFKGPKFTWFRRNGNGAGIFERLDCGVANPAWINTFHEGYIQHLTAASSDHRPIVLRTKNRDKGRNHPFRFESMWVGLEGCKVVVRNSWDEEERDGDMKFFFEGI